MGVTMSIGRVSYYRVSTNNIYSFKLTVLPAAAFKQLSHLVTIHWPISIQISNLDFSFWASLTLPTSLTHAHSPSRCTVLHNADTWGDSSLSVASSAKTPSHPTFNVTIGVYCECLVWGSWEICTKGTPLRRMGRVEEYPTNRLEW